jgi:hypothetical protein
MTVVVVAAGLTTCDKAPVLDKRLALPPKAAEMECVPTLSDEVLKEAEPPASATEPSVLDPSVKMMVPAGAPVPAGPVTIAVKVTVWPNEAGFELERSVVVLAAWVTTCDTLPLLAGNVVLPLYAAVMA